MKKIDIDLSDKIIQQAFKCETAEELVEFAKAHDYPLSVEQAENYLEELSSMNLTPEQLEAVAGGWGGQPNRDDVPKYWK